MTREEFISFPPHLDADAPFRLQLAGASYCDGNYRIKRSRCGTFVFEQVVEGRGYLVVDGRRYEPAAGDVYLVPAYTEHEYGSSADAPWTKLWFNTEGPLVQRLVDLYHLNGVHHVPKLDLRELFERAQSAIRANPAEAHKLAALAVHEIVIEIARKLRRDRSPQAPPEAERLKAFLDANVGGAAALETLAELVHKSPSQTIRIFKRHWGCTPHQYLLRRKLETAQALLANTAMGVKEVAFQLGFPDEYYFSNLFKAKTGKSPSSCRSS